MIRWSASPSNATSRPRRQRRVVSTSALPEGLSPAEIDAVVKTRQAAGEDLYHLDRGAFADLDPTLVVTQDLCAVCAVDVSEVDDAIAWLGCRADVLTLDPATLDEVIDSVLTVGAATDTEERAAGIVADCRERLAAVAGKVDGTRRPPTLVLEWTAPAFSAGHWVPDLVTAAGGEARLGHPGEKSVGLDWAEIAGCGAEVVIIAPCGFRLDGAMELAEQAVAAGALTTPVRGLGGRRRRVRRPPRSAGRRRGGGVRLHPPPRPLWATGAGGGATHRLTVPLGRVGELPRGEADDLADDSHAAPGRP